MSYELPELPFPRNALEPHISDRQMYFHYEKHHRGYIDKLNKALQGDERNGRPLEWLIKNTEGQLFNLAGQAWNHDFFWHSLRPDGGGEPRGELRELIDNRFQNLGEFKQAFTKVAVGEFGSGWAWVVFEPQQRCIEVMSTTDAENPVPLHVEPLLTIDVWEHAYYLDRQHDRAAYVEACLEHLLNWEFAAQNLAAARKNTAAESRRRAGS